MRKYIVRDLVCDSAVYCVFSDNTESLIEVLNSRRNALTVCEILNADIKKEDGFYTIWKDEQIKKLENEVENLNNALRLAVELYCHPGSHPAIRKEIENYSLISGVVKYLKETTKEKKQ